MHYGHIASDKVASICERSLLSFVISVDFFFRRTGVVYKSNYNLKTNRQSWINVLLG